MERRPLLVVIRGIFAPPDQMAAAVEAFPEADVVFPALAAASVEAAICAYDDLLNDTRRPAVICGVSLGGVIALGLRSPFVQGVLALDPPLLTGDLWPIRHWLKSPISPQDRELVFNAFGLSDEGHENRDYTPFLSHRTAPTVCLLGSEPLEPERPYAGPPSFVSEPARRSLAAHPAIRTVVVPDTGHDIGRGGSKAIYDALRWLLACAMAEQT